MLRGISAGSSRRAVMKNYRVLVRKSQDLVGDELQGLAHKPRLAAGGGGGGGAGPGEIMFPWRSRDYIRTGGNEIRQKKML